jgi:hypothetical protein
MHPTASCVKSVVLWWHPIDRHIKSIVFLLAFIKSVIFLMASYRHKYQKPCVCACILSPHVLKVLFFAGIISTQISKALCVCWHSTASCVKSVVSCGHHIDTHIKSIMFSRASYRQKSQKHNVFAGILSPHVLKLSLPGLENKTCCSQRSKMTEIDSFELL